ncbi:MAG: DUF6884 domain-containing protein [Egibacteraceae bacterium]
MNLVIAGCTNRKLATTHPVPAFELYQGSCIPQLRARIGLHRSSRDRVRFLSARHGLVRADTPLLVYDQRLTAERARQLRPEVTATLEQEFATGGVPEEILLLLEPLYLVPLADLLAHPSRPPLRWIPDPGGGWAQAEAVLDAWGWP